MHRLLLPLSDARLEQVRAINATAHPASEAELRVWDIAGQAVCYNTCRFFFLWRAVYLVVCCPRNDPRLKEAPHSVATVLTVAGTLVTIVLVSTHADDGECGGRAG